MRHTAMRSVFINRDCRRSILFLAFFWLAGLFAGFIFGDLACVDSSFMTLFDPSCSLTLYGFLVFLLPFAVSAIAVRFSVKILFFSACFLKAFFYGFSLYFIAASYGSAAWLHRVFLLFSDSFIVVTMLLFWLRQISNNFRTFKLDFLFSIFVVLIVAIIDYLLISPFWVDLMNYL